MRLHAHPFSSYSQKALIALYENHTPFEFQMLEDAESMDRLGSLWPLQRFPILEDGDQIIVEASTIIEHLAVRHAGAVRLIPVDPSAAVEVRMLDRIFDNYVSNPQQKIVFDSIRPEAEQDAQGAAEARSTMQAAYGWLNRHMQDRLWAAGADFTLADCAAAPALFYADWTHPIDAEFAALRAYRARLLDRPSFARAVEEARPYRRLFPLGAPNRD